MAEAEAGAVSDDDNVEATYCGRERERERLNTVSKYGVCRYVVGDKQGRRGNGIHPSKRSIKWAIN